MKTVSINNVVFGGNEFPLIAGPCVMESKDHTLSMAESIQNIADKVQMPFIFKSSFDKANRTSLDSYRGLPMEEGLNILFQLKKELGVTVLTDIHSPNQAAVVAEVADVLQIPAFLCRQTDLLLAAGKTGKTINIKKGQFLSPFKMKHTAEKVASTGNHNILLTDRGTTFGYENLISDMRAIPIMQASSGYPVLFDATHSAQQPSGAIDITGGAREYIPPLAKAAVAAGCDGMYMEVHDNVEHAKSDAATQWPLESLESLLIQLNRIREAVV